ncbi:MAG: phosphoribosyl-ATP diphosphatase [Deltaproteobacteria bacterium]|nr:phosphoribosyl-ATP diphosphatase [Deltaproteobacteria bacterium]MBW2417602.1 phosphoribosyl-ATP diphosphatase [Deltaproteobacteria bacterium]
MGEAEILDRLFGVIRERAEQRPEGSYVVQLLDGGLPRIAAKLREETEELIEAAGEDDRDHTAREAADLLFHVWVLLGAAGLSPDDVYGVLGERFGIGGLAEKATRAERKGAED